MTYDPTIPAKGNIVTSTSGDLAKARGNFELLAAMVSGTERDGTAPADAIKGIYLGDADNRKLFFIQSDASDIFRVQRNIGTEGSPSWQNVIALTSVSGADVEFAMKALGQTPTSSSHLATKGYVDSATLSGLTDVVLSGLAADQILVYSGGNWVNADHVHTLDELTNVAIVSPTSGDSLVYDGAQWGTGRGTFSGLSDTSISGATSGDVAVFDGTQWGLDALKLSNLRDTAVSGAVSGQVLEFDGAVWVPGTGSTGTLSGLDDTDVAGATSGQVLEFNGVDWAPQDFSAGTLSGLTDTEVSGATSGQVMEFDGVYWRNKDFSAGTLSGLTDTAVSGATSGQALISNGAGSWVPGSVGASATLQVWSPDAAPASGDAADDEFNDITLSGAWTEWDPGSHITVTETSGQVLKLSATKDAGMGGVYRSWVGEDATVYSKMWIMNSQGEDYHEFGLLFADSDLPANPSTSNFVNVQVRFHSGSVTNGFALSVALTHSNNYNSFDKTYFTSGASFSAGQPIYVRARVNHSAITIGVDVSLDGLIWREIGSADVSSDIGTISVFGLMAHGNDADGAGIEVAYDYLRVRRTLDAASPLMGGFVTISGVTAPYTGAP